MIFIIFDNLRDGFCRLFVAAQAAMLDGIDGDDRYKEDAGDNERELHIPSVTHAQQEPAAQERSKGNSKPNCS